MSITEAQFIQAIETKNGFPLDPNQTAAILFGNGPLLLAAGPGTGKTEVLVARSLKLICCDAVPPGSIMLTTFTEKAARSLQDRLFEAFAYLTNSYPQDLQGIEPSSIRIGTLHALCNEILQEYRYTSYQNLRLLDETESALLLYRRVVNNIDPYKADLFSQFNSLFRNKPFNALSKWDWALALQKLLSRLIEDRIDLQALQQAGGPWSALEAVNALYDQELGDTHSSDFSRLLRHFRSFLDTAQGDVFLSGDGSAVRLPLLHVLVDEYQDTNPIQESIYLRLCDTPPHNLTIVGDDDQALYRFRGGTVECMVGFSSACSSRWHVDPQTIYLTDNHRSDSDIVNWCNAYIGSFPLMAQPNVRIPGKPPLNPTLGRRGAYPAVSLIRAGTIPACATAVATLVSSLRTHGIIGDYSQCALLLRSTRNSPNFAGPYITALRAQNVPIYNPRSKDYLEQPEIGQCLGAFIRIIDPQLQQAVANLSPAIVQLIQGWVGEYDTIAPANPSLGQYVTQSAQTIANTGPGERVATATLAIVYRILSFPPFVNHQMDPEKDLRLSKLTRLFESFSAQYGRDLWTDNAVGGRLPGWWYSAFYYGLCGLLVNRGMDDDEEEDVICPADYFPIMTVHQAKGLEFDFVFVGNLGLGVSPSDAHFLEADLRPYRESPPAVIHAPNEASWHDDIRQHFVAYSRAKFALILVATTNQLNRLPTQTASFGHQGGAWVRQNFLRL